MQAVFASLLEEGALNLLVSFGKPFFAIMISYYFMCKLLPNRLNTCSLIAISLVYATWYILRLPGLLGTGYHLWMTIFINAWTLFVLIFIFKGKFWRRVIVYWYFEVIKSLCEAVAYVPILLYDNYRGFRGQWAEILSRMESSTMLKYLYVCALLPLLLLLGFLSLKIWRRLLLEKFQPFYLLFVVLPFGQTFSLSNVIHPNMGNPMFGIMVNFIDDVSLIYHILSLFGILVCLVCDVVILCYILSYDKKALLEKELLETRRLRELEQARYREIERRGEEMAKIRHDFNNQLVTIIRLARTSEGEAAQDMIHALGDAINRAETEY